MQDLAPSVRVAACVVTARNICLHHLKYWFQLACLLASYASLELNTQRSSMVGGVHIFYFYALSIIYFKNNHIKTVMFFLIVVL